MRKTSLNIDGSGETWLDRAFEASLNICWRRRLHNGGEEKAHAFHAVNFVPRVLRWR
jgi:hypothetical protein